jgi:hypothetical protein
MINKKQVFELQEELKCSQFEAYKLLLDIERNSILREGFGVNLNNSPSFLEAIAIALGFEKNGLETTLNNNLGIIADNVESLGSLIENLNERYSD